MENTMLIVDDAEINREILKALFGKDYTILEAENGEEALNILDICQDNIDIILLDLMMPNLSGFDLLEVRKGLEYFRNTPVVVITSSGHMEDQIKAFELGANDFILKPFVPEIVVTRINNVMNSHKRMLSIRTEAMKLKIRSELDEMTGLCNKTTTEISIDEVLKNNGNQLNVMLVIDIDNFKTVNDTSGHLAGDHVIKIIGDLIASMFRKTDIVGRIGGDEFLVMMVGVDSMDAVYLKVNELIQTMRYKPNLTIPEYVTLSIGVASNNNATSTYAELFKKADEALYSAKHDGKACYREYAVQPVSINEDKRPAVLLISNNRSVCSVVHSFMPPELRIVEALNLEDLDLIEKAEKDKVAIVYVDVSDREDDGEAYWDKIKKYHWIKPDKIFAICQEGNVSQYMTALKMGVLDMFTVPIDTGAFKRRIMKQYDKLNPK